MGGGAWGLASLFLPVCLMLVAACGAGGGDADDGGEYVFLFAWETNSRAGAPGLLRGERELAVFDPDQRRLHVPRQDDLPPPGARVVVLHQLDTMGMTLGTRLFALRSLPASVPLQEPFSVTGWLAPPGGSPRTGGAVDESGRLLPFPLRLESVDGDGRVRMTLGSHGALLAPGEG
ncbi:MAG: hypothetical protein IRY95_10320, partial [Clostridia bacterium]|nr:hypothetical protein [Clostridia bacterium]